jgi:formyl-CoA transferase
MHVTVNRNKRSLSLDLRRPEGLALFLELARRSDVLIENFRPGTLARWGAGYPELRAIKPDLVYVSISGFGQWGPWSDRVGYDPLAQAASGFMSLNGSPDGQPVKSPTFLADDLGGLHAALATLAALRHRDATGEGQHVDVALLDAMLFQSTGYLTLGAMGIGLPRLGNEYRVAAPANTYTCRDGQIMAGVLLDSHWVRMAELLGRPELGRDPDFAKTPERIARRREVDQLVADWARERSVEQALAALHAADLPAAKVQTYAEAAQHPAILAREMLQTPSGPAGAAVPVTGPAAKLSRTPLSVRTAAPALGAHNEEILDELGVPPEERSRLRELGVL